MKLPERKSERNSEDVDWSVEALSDSSQTEENQINIIPKGLVQLLKLTLYSITDAIIIGFNVRPVGNARQLADKEIDIRLLFYYLANAAIDAPERMLGQPRDEKRFFN
jgi:translation initiation factor IF-2